MKQLRETYGLDFWDDTLVRVIKTFFQALLGSATVAVAGSAVGLGAVAWPAALSIAAMSALYALFTAIAGAQAKALKAEEYKPRRALDENLGTNTPQEATGDDLSPSES